MVGDALDTAAAFVHAHLTRTDVVKVYREGGLSKAFVFPQARVLLEST